MLSFDTEVDELNIATRADTMMTAELYLHQVHIQGVIPGGAGGGAVAPQLLANNTFSGFSHTTDRKVPSEVVLMGSFMSVINMVMSDKLLFFS